MQAGTSNRTALRYVAETSMKVTPATPALKTVRYTGESITYNIRNTTSNEIRSDRMTSDLIQVGAGVEGDINFELSFESFDDLIQAALCGTWSAPSSGVSTIKNGTVLRSFTIQKHFQDLATPIYQNFRGCRIGGMSLDFQTGSILTGSFSMMGCAAEMVTSQITGATTPAAPATEPMNAVSNLGGLEKDNVAMTAQIRSMTLELNNNLRGQEAIGTLGYVGIALGKLDITGNIELYFEDGSEYTSFLTNDEFRLEFTVTDADSNSYKFTLPRIKYEEGTIVSGGLDQDLMVSGTWRALYDATDTCMIEITKTDATP